MIFKNYIFPKKFLKFQLSNWKHPITFRYWCNRRKQFLLPKTGKNSVLKTGEGIASFHTLLLFTKYWQMGISTLPPFLLIVLLFSLFQIPTYAAKNVCMHCFLSFRRINFLKFRSDQISLMALILFLCFSLTLCT